MQGHAYLMTLHLYIYSLVSFFSCNTGQIM